MPQKSEAATNARAQALFKRRQEQQADAPVAMAEYRAAERAQRERMHELRALRLAQEAQLRSEPARSARDRRDQARTPVRGS